MPVETLANPNADLCASVLPGLEVGEEESVGEVLARSAKRVRNAPRFSSFDLGEAVVDFVSVKEERVEENDEGDLDGSGTMKG